MANFFLENDDLQFNFSSLQLQDVVKLMENNYQQDSRHAEVHQSYEEAIEYYRLSLELLGQLCGDEIAARRQSVDEQGTSLVNGEVIYAEGTTLSRKTLSDSGFMGAILPREHGGAHVPSTVYMAMIELVSRADASLMTLFGYQDVGELIARFGTSEQGKNYLPKLASGEHLGAIVLTEPGAGSDLQSIRIKARQDESGNWTLNGTKHFISNGCGEVLMVLARSEEGTDDIFGLSLFVCSGGDKVTVNRVEEKMGLHGSPTCELFFDNAPAELLGKRRFGLTKYILESLSQARFSVAAQSIGIAQGAYEAAHEYAQQRKQFKQFIIDIPAVSEMLISMRVELQTSRALLYHGVYWQDLKVQLETYISNNKNADKAILRDKQKQLRKTQSIVNLLSPMTKYWVTESSTKVCHQAQQVFGGMGYIRETGMEQYVRDVRITTIYEGTSQVQVAASIKAVMADVLADYFSQKERRNSELEDLVEYKTSQTQLVEIRKLFDDSVAKIKEKSDSYFTLACAQIIVNCYAGMLAGHLLLDQVEKAKGKLQQDKLMVASRQIAECLATSKSMEYIVSRGIYQKESD